MNYLQSNGMKSVTYSVREQVNTKFLIGMMVRVFAKWSARPGFNPRSSRSKDSKNGS